MDCDIDDRQAIDEGFIITVVDNTRNKTKKRQVMYNPVSYTHLTLPTNREV